MEEYLEKIEAVADWLYGARQAAEEAGDDCIRYACKEGSRRLLDILEEMSQE